MQAGPDEAPASSEARVPPAELPEPPISLIGLVLSPRFQRAAGPLAVLVLLAGYASLPLGRWLGVPRAEVLALAAVGCAVSLASVAVVLGVVLLVAREAPHRGRAALSIGLGALAFLIAGPLFLGLLGGQV